MSLIVARSWREFDKQQAIGLLSLYKKIWFLKPQFHFVINGDINQNWVNFTNQFLEDSTVTLYTTDEMDVYCKSLGVDDNLIFKFKNWGWIYHIILYHYLHSKHNVDYLLTYDDDILFNENNIDEVIGCLVNKVPFAIGESQIFSDKAMFGRLCHYFHNEYDININFWYATNQDVACNSGFMGINADFFSRYKSLNDICNLFSYTPYTHQEILHYADFKRFKEFFHGLLEEQSFLSINNKAFNPSTHITLRDKDGYNIEYKEIDALYSKKSKIEHYLGVKKYQDFYKNRIQEEFNAFRFIYRNNLHIADFLYKF